jgi:DNA-binding transcriptional LysR family regulator
MYFNHLRHFYFVAKQGSFTRASRAIRIQQPAISKSVKQLEQSLGLVLLERGKRSVTLTPAGKKIYELCGEIFDRIAAVEQVAEAENRELSGPLAFGASDSIVQCLAPAWMKSFLKKHPKVRPQIFSGSSREIMNEIKNDQIEFGLFFTKPEDDFLLDEKIADIPFYLVARHDFVEGECLPLIASRTFDYSKKNSFPVMEMLKRHGLRAELIIATNHLEAQKRSVMDGLGVGLFPAFHVEKELKTQSLKLLKPKNTFSYPLRIVHRRGKYFSRPIEEFKIELRKFFRDLS